MPVSFEVVGENDAFGFRIAPDRWPNCVLDLLIMRGFHGR